MAREIIDWSDNFTCGGVPNALLDIPANLRTAISPKKGKKPTEKMDKLREYLQKPVEDVMIDMRLKPTEKHFKQMTPDIKDHLEAGIHAFFVQVMLLKETNRKYALHETDFQIGSGKCRSPKKKLPSDTFDKTSRYAAAHFSVITSLKYTRPDGKEVAFADRTFFNFTMNGTDLLPREANEIDTLIHGKNGKNAKTKKLREKTLEIINNVAKKNSKVTPNEALNKFVNELISQIVNAKKSQENKAKIHKAIVEDLTTIKLVKGKPKKLSKSKKEKLKKSKAWLKKDEVKKHVLSCYESVAKHYKDKLAKRSTGDVLIRKLCFKASKDDAKLKVDKAFYDTVQKEMQELLKVDLFGADIDEQVIEKDKKFAVKRSARLQSAEPEKALDPLGPTHQKYLKHCLTIQKVKDIAAKCLNAPKDTKLVGELNVLVKSTIAAKFTNAKGAPINPRGTPLISNHIIQQVHQKQKKAK